jgi:hypothetical protein
MAVVGTAYAIANAMGASPKVMLSLFEAGLVESGFQNLKNAVDHDSLGYLQQRPSQGWPDPTNVETATRSYVSRAKANETKYPDYTPGQLAQSVQRSAFPDRYDQRESEARGLISKFGGTTPAGGSVIGGVLDSAQTLLTGAPNVGGLATQLLKLALPTNIVRACAGGLGVILLLTGIILLGKQVKA